MTKTPQHNVPELRFPEFEGEWEEKKLGDIASFSKGKSLSKKDISENGVACILYGELYTKYNAFIDEIYSKTSVDKSTLVQGKENQILIPSSGEKSEDIATASCLVSNKVVYIGGDINIITPKKDKGRFISLSLNSVNKNEIAKFAQGKSVVHLYNDHLKKTKIKIPNNLNEQEKIGTFFSKLDRQIELEEQKLEKLEEQKKGYMQKIFSQELRFKDANGNDYPDWKKEKLDNILEFESERTKVENEYPVLTSSRNGLILQSEYYKEGKTFADSNIGYFIIPKGYITYRSRSDDGKFQFNLNNIIDVGIVSKYYPVFRGINMNQSFLTMLMNHQLKKEYIKFATGTSQLVLSQRNLREISTELPITEEQEKIGNFFDKQNSLIEKQSNKVELLKERKKGFLQKMFI
ncbi:restriction endonuclease subunit S [Staphylococcus chromogenes]|uniref:restriction endonuclease subunit S n=1 Tax=Staphylococcus chromogenes TaxID=46126 RepID=UPI000D1AAD03|nr:restriction endonuclease subunit S [Staphylococcus chromogenes]PTF95441.1 restriction endonuclease subunit S [Staphylococcus chromogenes]RIL98306.1 restriction endonuclease subunit S [Staphylococcus chromogenes]